MNKLGHVKQNYARQRRFPFSRRVLYGHIHAPWALPEFQRLCSHFSL